ncbi:TonB-dependent receptor [Sphingomonas koreensis]|nr:TonB-dependent receptor [Sphingomonas koreensis]
MTGEIDRLCGRFGIHRIGRSLLLVSASAAAIMTVPAAAFAQSAPEQGAPAQDNNTTSGSASADVSAAPRSPATAVAAGNLNGQGQIDAPVQDAAGQDIIVTGLRGSLQRNLDIKRSSAGVVDAISAEDIGKFPDSNVAAALQRVPGVSISRGTSSLGGLPATTGDATAITVRGFGPAFNETLFDGRQVSTGTGNRGFDFSSVGADFVGEVDVLKTPDAALSSGAIGATINVQYPKPFDHPGLRIAASASGSINDDEGKIEPAGGLLFSDTFADDTFGILADVAYTRHRTQTNHINNQGWEGTHFAPCQLSGSTATTCTPTSPTADPPPAASDAQTVIGFYPQDYGIYQEHTTDTRIDGRLALQWHPSDDVLVTLNDDYSREKVRAEQYGFSVWFNSASLTDVALDDNGTATSFVQPNTPTDFQGQINQEVLENNEFGANLKWDASEHLKIELDADRSQSWLNPDGQLSSIDADVGYGGPNATNLGFNTNGSSGLPVVSNYGPAGDGSAFLDSNIIGSHVLPYTSTRNKDTLDQFKALASWTQDDLKITFGGQYLNDKRKLRLYSDLASNNHWQAYSGYGPASGSATGVALPQDFFGNSFSTKDFIPGFSGSGDLPPMILAVDPLKVLNYLQGLGNPQAMNIPGFNYGGGVIDFNGTYVPVVVPGSSQDLSEQTFAGFLTASFKTNLGDMPLHINVGVRQEWSRTNSAGLAQLPVAIVIQSGDHTAEAVTLSDPTAVSTTHRYNYLLPNIDVNLDITDKFKIRFDASRTLTRPPLNLLTPVLNVPNTERVNSLVASGGNPTLDPYLSDNLDVGAEWYYQRNSYLSIDAFRKQVSNFIVGGSTIQTINDVVDPATGQTAQFVVTQQVNGPTATVYGLEIALQHVFGDSGFGIQANGTLVGTNKPFDRNDLSVSGFAVTGLANSANAVAFYDKNGFQARVALNWRDEYLDHFGQQQNTSAFGNEPTFVNSSAQVDFSSSYDITKNVSVFVEALNLNNETLSTHGRYSDQILDAFKYGRRFTAGLHIRY